MGDARTLLEREYCPPIDPATLFALTSDFDLDREDQVHAARALLDTIKEASLSEDATGFDESGTGGNAEAFDAGRQANLSLGDSGTASSGETERTSLSNDLRALDLQQGDGDHLDGLNEEAKILWLLQIFEDGISWRDAQYALHKCNGRVSPAIDELLTVAYFKEAQGGEGESTPPFKGVDAFSDENMARRRRKGKAKSNGARVSSDRDWRATPEPQPAPLANLWQSAQEDVQFIASRVHTSHASVLSIYHCNGASVLRTIAALIQASNSKSRHEDDDPVFVSNVADLIKDVATLAEDEARALVRLTHPSTVAAHELARAYTSRSPNGGVQIIPNYVPLLKPDDEEIAEGLTGSIHPVGSSATFRHLHLGAAERAAAHAADRDGQRLQASIFARKAKSDRLMGAAAAYYSQQSRDTELNRRVASAEAMDERAAAQSSPTQLDLHGIDVLNAVRIARTYVNVWWANLGENRANGRVGAAERRVGFRVIVGRGTHSEGGKSKIGPAVRKMLSDGGWRFETEAAAIVIKGRAKS